MPLLSVELAQDKAYTAVSFGIPTHEWFDFIKGDQPLLVGIPKTRRLVVFGGGYPLRAAGQVIGGVGVSGGHYSQDMQVAEAGMADLARLIGGDQSSGCSADAAPCRPNSSRVSTSFPICSITVLLQLRRHAGGTRIDRPGRRRIGRSAAP